MACNRCSAQCERLVYPEHCLQSNCRFVYAYMEGKETYFGCIQKVFKLELHLESVKALAAEGGFGALKAQRTPLAECHSAVKATFLNTPKHRLCR